MRTLSILALTATLALTGCCATQSLPDLGCEEDDECPPVEDIMLPGHQVPVYETICEPIYEVRRIPLYGQKTVEVYQTRRVPVTMTVTDHCGCDRVLTLWDREEKIQVGVRRVPACIGYRMERVQVGTCPKRVQTGWRMVEEPCAPTP